MFDHCLWCLPRNTSGVRDDCPTHPHWSLDHDCVTSTEVDVYGKRSQCGFTVSQTSPTTLSHEPLELRTPGLQPSPPCSLPLWSALELPTGTVRVAWNQTEACSNPVIKILFWMLILWKKPNDFTACLLFFSVSWKAKIHSAKWIRSVDNICCWKKNVSEWGSCRQEKKMKYCITKDITAVRSLP